MKNHPESGVTLIELLASVAILSLIMIPIISTLSDSYLKIGVQGEETQIQFFAQEVMESTITNPDLFDYLPPDPDHCTGENDCLFDQGECSTRYGCYSSIQPDTNTQFTYQVKVMRGIHQGIDQFYDIWVEVHPPEGENQWHPTILFTVIRR